MTDQPNRDDDGERRDAVLRRMLATPKASKVEKKGDEPKPVAHAAKRRKKPAST